MDQSLPVVVLRDMQDAAKETGGAALFNTD